MDAGMGWYMPQLACGQGAKCREPGQGINWSGATSADDPEAQCRSASGQLSCRFGRNEQGLWQNGHLKGGYTPPTQTIPHADTVAHAYSHTCTQAHTQAKTRTRTQTRNCMLATRYRTCGVSTKLTMQACRSSGSCSMVSPPDAVMRYGRPRNTQATNLGVRYTLHYYFSRSL